MRIGIDLGGTKIAGVLLAPDGRVLAEERIATPSSSDEIIASIAALVERLERVVGVSCSVGVGTPGALSPRSGLLRNSNTQCLNGLALDALLSGALQRSVRIANDANCFALSEAVDGAARAGRVVFGVIVGTGTGGGLVVDKKVLSGRHAIAGEWGHNPLPWPEDDERLGAACYCGKHGCIETWLAGPSLSRDHFAHTQERFTAEVIASRAEAGDLDAHATLVRYADRMARALASVINIVDPDVIVLGGGVSNIEALYPLVREALPRWVFSDYVDVPLVRATHGDASGVRGAAWLW
jgi:fructokinase